ncbi:MAG: hypothetical protein RL228_144 [Actinomycetota bacterium]|jgi:hypothetical protein
MKSDQLWKDLGLAAPARRALINAGIKTLLDLKKWNKDDLAELHGIGPNALVILKPYLKR